MRRDLTEREKAIIKYISDGFIDEEIAERLNTGISNTRRLILKIFDKTDTNNRANLVSWGFRNNILN